MIFSHGTSNVDQHVFVNGKDTAKALAASGNGAIYPVIIGCFDYSSEITHRNYQTGFIFRLIRYKATRPDLRFGISPIADNITLASDLRLEAVPGGQYAK